MQTNLTCFLHKEMGSRTLLRFWIKTKKRCNLWIESGVHRSSSISESPTHVAWSTNLPDFASDSPQFSSRKLRCSSAQRERQAGTQAGREGGSEETGQGLLLNFFDPARTKDQEFVLVIFNFYFFCPFLFSFLEEWEFFSSWRPKKKKRVKGQMIESSFFGKTWMGSGCHIIRNKSSEVAIFQQ